MSRGDDPLLGREPLDHLDDIGRDILDFIEAEMPKGLFQKLKLLPKVKRLKDIFPRTVRSGPCQEVMLKGNDVDRLLVWER